MLADDPDDLVVFEGDEINKRIMRIHNTLDPITQRDVLYSLAALAIYAHWNERALLESGIPEDVLQEFKEKALGAPVLNSQGLEVV